MPLFVSRRPHLSQKGYFNAAKIGPRGPYVAREPFVAPPGIDEGKSWRLFQVLANTNVVHIKSDGLIIFIL